MKYHIHLGKYVSALYVLAVSRYNSAVKPNIEIERGTEPATMRTPAE